MRTLIAAFLALTFAAAPAAARAGWFVEGSLGQGWEYKPDHARQPLNVMVTPGYQILDVLSLECGAVATFANVKDSKFDVQLRPMAELSIPLFPIYAKAILGITGLADNPVKIQYGGALGGRFGLAGVGVFLEAGVLPTNVQVKDATTGATSNQLIWIAEGRLGLRFG
jgi:hypothetical protein